MTKYFFVLGAPDPEMEAIERLLVSVGVPYEYAYGMNGRRVTRATAYWAVGLGGGRSTGAMVLVECGGDEDFAGARGVRVDHHHPGDPGYGRGPEEAVAASSIGQVISILAGINYLPRDWEVVEGTDHRSLGEIELSADGAYVVGMTPLWVDAPGSGEPYGPTPMARVAVIPEGVAIVAAADHCPAAAYQGRVPGVDPVRLALWRAESRAAFQGRTVEAVLADVEAAAHCLTHGEYPWGDPAPMVLGGVVDLRESPPIPELPEASLRTGVPYLASLPMPDGRTQVVLGGAGEGTVAGTRPVEAFLGGWAAAHGLTDPYGDPARGYAGAYTPGVAP